MQDSSAVLSSHLLYGFKYKSVLLQLVTNIPLMECFRYTAAIDVEIPQIPEFLEGGIRSN